MADNLGFDGHNQKKDNADTNFLRGLETCYSKELNKYAMFSAPQRTHGERHSTVAPASTQHNSLAVCLTLSNVAVD